MYPYKSGDRVMLGISTWQHPVSEIPPGPMSSWPSPLPVEYRSPEGPSGPFTRYFKAATVIANDREAGVMVIKTDEPHAGGHGYDELHFEDFDGEEVVPFDETLPQSAAEAHRAALAGNIN